MMLGSRLLAMLPLAIALTTGVGRAAAIRICDGHARHVDCHFSGGGQLVTDVPAGEMLTYGLPTLAFSDRGRIHVVVGTCEIICDTDSR